MLLASAETAIVPGWKWQNYINDSASQIMWKLVNGRNGQQYRSASPRQILSKSVKLQSKYGDFLFLKTPPATILDFEGDFLFLQDGGGPPSWICNACVRTAHSRHLVVFTTVKNLVGIDAIFLLLCVFFEFANLA